MAEASTPGQLETNESNRSLSRLPPELRLQVYAEMLKDFNGDPKVCHGLLNSCKFLQAELMPEMLTAFAANLIEMVAAVQRHWLNEYHANPQPLRIFYAGTTLDDVVVNVEIPHSILRDEERFPGLDNDDNDNGFGLVCEILHPLLTFRIKQLNFSVYLDPPMLSQPLRADDEPFFHTVLEDLSCLLSRGHLKQFSNSPTGRDATYIDKVLVKQMTFDWSIANASHLCQMEVNARCIAMKWT